MCVIMILGEKVNRKVQEEPQAEAAANLEAIFKFRFFPLQWNLRF